MRLDRFHAQVPLLRVGQEVELDADEARHLAGVLRRAAGDRVTLFDGSGIEARATVLAAEKRSARVVIDELHAGERTSATRIVVAVALPRGGEAFDVLRTAIEAGADAIRPLLARRSVHRPEKKDEERRQERFRKLAISTMKQSGRNLMPVLEEPAPIASLRVPDGAVGFHGTIDPAAPPLVRAVSGGCDRPREAIAVIGPEGGLAPEEETALAASGFAAFSLGPFVMRVEIAVCAATAILAGAFARPPEPGA